MSAFTSYLSTQNGGHLKDRTCSPLTKVKTLCNDGECMATEYVKSSAKPTAVLSFRARFIRVETAAKVRAQLTTLRHRPVFVREFLQGVTGSVDLHEDRWRRGRLFGCTGQLDGLHRDGHCDVRARRSGPAAEQGLSIDWQTVVE